MQLQELLVSFFLLNFSHYFSSLCLNLYQWKSDPEIKDISLNSMKLEDIADKYYVHSRTVKRYTRKLFPWNSHLSAGRHAIVSSAMKHYIELCIITGHRTIAKELFRELGKFGYLLMYRSGVNALRSINCHRELTKKKAFLKKDHWKKADELSKKASQLVKPIETTSSVLGWSKD